MTQILLLSLVFLLACLMLSSPCRKLGVILLPVFVLLGLVFCSDGWLPIEGATPETLTTLCSVALLFIVFSGGFSTDWKAAKTVRRPALLLSIIGTFISVGVVALFAHFLLNVPWLEAFLLGSVVSSIDSASVIAILRTSRLHLLNNSASLLALESASNVPVSSFLTVLFVSVLRGNATGWEVPHLIAKQLLLGLAVGLLLAFITFKILKKMQQTSYGMETIFLLIMAALSFILPESFSGNGFLSCYIFAIILGNQELRKKKEAVRLLENLSGLAQILTFFILGIIVVPKKIVSSLVPGLGLAVFLTFVVRPLSTLLLLAPFKTISKRQKLLTSWAGVHGTSAIVLLVFALSLIRPQSDLLHLTFWTVVFSVLLQGTLLPLFSSLLKMVDKTGNVMKSFTDYSEKESVQFIKVIIPRGHDWCGKTIEDLVLPPMTSLIMVIRQNQPLTLSEELTLQEQDKVILTSSTPEVIQGIELSELHLNIKHPYVGKKISQIDLGENEVLLMVRRGLDSIIPKGDFVLESGDTLILNYEG